MNDLVLLRAASGPSIGIGHAVRSAAVAEAVRARGGRPRLVLDDAGTAALLARADFEATTASEWPGWADARAAGAWLDGFRDWSDELARLRAAGTPGVVVENRGPARNLCHRIVYPALHYKPDDWDRRHPERVRAGAAWIPLREAVRRTEREPEPDVDLLVSFGGSDPHGQTERALAALPREPLRVAVAIGPHMGPRREAIEQAAARLPDALVVEPGEALPAWMARSRRALTALGTTLYELAYLRVPALILANYRSDREALDHYAAHGPHRPLGIAPELSDAQLAAALRRGIEAETGGPAPAVTGLGPGADTLAGLLLEPDSA